MRPSWGGVPLCETPAPLPHTSAFESPSMPSTMALGQQHGTPYPGGGQLQATKMLFMAPHFQVGPAMSLCGGVKAVPSAPLASVFL